MTRMLKSFITLLIIVAVNSFPQSPEEIIQKSLDKMYSKSNYAEITMTIVKPNWSRSTSMKSWAIEPDYFLIYITEPARDKGTVTLKRENEVWNWIPAVQKPVKIPPSMMLQSWMGSDFTNDDLVRSSSYVNDFTHKLLGEEKIDGELCYKIEMKPKPSAGVVWNKIITWVTKKNFLQLKADYYDEDDFLVKTFVGSKIKKMGGREIPTYWEMISYADEGNKTILIYNNLQFDVKLDKSFFSIQNMQKVK